MRPFNLPVMAKLLSLMTLPLILVACATPASEEETAIAEEMIRDIRPESRAVRDDISRLDILSQAAFWAKEYENNPADREAALELARIVRVVGNPGRAATIGSQALALFPDDRDLLLVTGQALIEDGHAQNAIAFLQSALQQDPANPKIISAIGVAYDQSGNHDQAINHFTRALAFSPEDPNILSNIGLSHALQGDPVTAEKWLLRANAQPGASAKVRQNLALVLGLQGKFNEAEAMAANDLPGEVAKQNVHLIKTMITRPQAWQALRSE